MQSKIERVAGFAMAWSRPYLAEYGSVRSRHDFTQRQLMGCLILRAYLRTTYRGLVDVLAGRTGLRKVLGMGDKVPHYTTLQQFSARSQVLEIVDLLLAKIGQAALRGAAAGPERPERRYADAGYDADCIHAWCREQWGAESFFSGLKPMTGSALTARLPARRIKEAAIRGLACALHR